LAAARQTEGGEEALGRGGVGVPDVLARGTEAHHLTVVRGGDDALRMAARGAGDVDDEPSRRRRRSRVRFERHSGVITSSLRWASVRLTTKETVETEGLWLALPANEGIARAQRVGARSFRRRFVR
jgi:hypothetical protein